MCLSRFVAGVLWADFFFRNLSWWVGVGGTGTPMNARSGLEPSHLGGSIAN